MAARPVPDAKLRRCVELLNEVFAQGFEPGRGAAQEASRRGQAEGLFSNGVQVWQWVHIAKERLGIEPDESLYRPARYQQPVPRAVINAAPPARLPEPGKGSRVLAIGDLHQDPRHPDRLQVLTWIARFASEHRFERIVQVGDWSTFDSVNMHDDNRTLAARTKPGIRDDLDNLRQSHAAFRRGMDEDYRPKMDFLLGNHENRLERFENSNPEAQGTFTLGRDETFLQYGWRSRPYGELFYLGGVAFTHHPTNGAGRAYGGKTGPQRAANESTVPVVSGHTHRRQVHDSPKIGPIDVISMVEIGCALPWGTVEHYARHGLTGWWWGVVPMEVRDGAITDLNFVSMITLRDRYSDAGGDIAA
jgi:hypothetical protein